MYLPAEKGAEEQGGGRGQRSCEPPVESVVSSGEDAQSIFLAFIKMAELDRKQMSARAAKPASWSPISHFCAKATWCVQYVGLFG